VVTVRSWVPVSAVLAPVALIGGWTWGAARQPAGFDSLRDTISALAATAAPDRWIMTLGLALLGAAHLATAVGFTELGMVARVWLAVGGVGSAAVAALPQPNDLHGPAATVAFVALALWPAFTRAAPRRTAIVVSGVLVAVLVWFALSLRAGELVGLSERVLAGGEALVPLGFVLAVRSRSRRT
jgi:hypothetical membrane protein